MEPYEKNIPSLADIPELVASFAALINETVKTNVEIVDTSLKRISGTSFFTGNKPVMADGTVYREVFQSGKYCIIQTPRRHPVCSRCHLHGRCLIAMEIAFPLTYKNNIVGAIGILCGSYAEKNKVTEDIGSHISFMQAIADLLEKALADYEFKNENILKFSLFQQAFMKSNSGILLIDENQKIIEVNDTAKKLSGGEAANGASVTIEKSTYSNEVTVSFSGSGLQVAAILENVTIEGAEINIIYLQNQPEAPAEKQDIIPIAELERAAIHNAILLCGDDTSGKKRAAELLGIGVATLYRKINEYQL